MKTEDLPYVAREKNELVQFLLFDWFECTILCQSLEFNSKDGTLIGVNDLYLKASEIMSYLFGFSIDSLVFEYKAVNGYNSSFSYGNIKIMWHTYRFDMGFHILMSGSACREFEDLGLDYYDLFTKLQQYDVNYNRLDVSLDDFTDRYFTIEKLHYWIKRGGVSSKFLSAYSINRTSLSDSSSLGSSVQFGSRASAVQVTFYDKKCERVAKGNLLSDNVLFWFRTELRLRSSHAKSFILRIISRECTINYLFKSYLSEYISFKILNSKDSHVYRRPDVSWWSDFLENVDKLDFKNYLPESSIIKKKNWIFDSVSKSNLMVLLSSMDTLDLNQSSSSYIVDLFKKGFDKNKFNDKDLEIINMQRIHDNLEPLTLKDIQAFINDLTEVILLKQHNTNYRKLSIIIFRRISLKLNTY